MAKEELFRNPLLGRLLLGVGAFPVRRGTADRRALKQALRVIENGSALGLFPEGTRGSPGELQEAKGGAAFVALRTEAPVLPVAIHGPYQLFDEVVVSIGEPFRLKVEGGSSKIDAAGQQIMEGIRRLLEKR
jgi:1-acyl-sn-glycerol-3-phosphate acyltransferase